MEDADWSSLVESTDTASIGLTRDLDWFVENAPGTWTDAFETESEVAILAVARVVDLLIPEWEREQSNDTLPIRTLEAVRQFVDEPDANLRKHVTTLAKGCTKSRQRSLGYQHRIAEAIRSLARAAVASSDDRGREELGEALAKVEEHIRYRYSCRGEYPTDVPIRRPMIEALVRGLSEAT